MDHAIAWLVGLLSFVPGLGHEAPPRFEVQCAPGCLSIEPKTTFRVCKKIAKVLYFKRKHFLIKKQTCEHMANAIDQVVRSFCHNDLDYKRKICRLIGRMVRNCDHFLETIVKGFKEGSVERLAAALETFVSGPFLSNL